MINKILDYRLFCISALKVKRNSTSTDFIMPTSQYSDHDHLCKLPPVQIVSFEFCRNEIYKNKDTKTGEQQQDGAVRDKGLWEGGASKINTVLRHRSRSRRLLDPPTDAIASLDKSVSLDCND
ncbi:hypothetical protein T01_4939 [Trichinella spiralis]|uniref:Uncharacterized protein n=1 Tax=Trichinella spiralis TaxID=6334 RepID=A0A0V1ASU2_TRISP|nr:hypothetical protein T01_4939 [Trichinella spiralis]